MEDGEPTANRGFGGGMLNARCLGSDCMAWRWMKMPQARFVKAGVGINDEPERPAHITPEWDWVPAEEDDGAVGGWLEPESQSADRRVGFCGLAGRPDYE